MSKQPTKRDRDGALAKLEKAGLTERQYEALTDMILRDAVRRGETLACSDNIDGKRMHTKRVAGIGGPLSVAGDRHAFEAVRIAVYWYLQRQVLHDIPEGSQYAVPDQFENWRPGREYY